MKNEFFVTLFSNSSTAIYPKNSKSKFTCKLPVSLDFHTNQNYSVGLVDCVFPRILGTTENADEEMDAIKLPENVTLPNKTLIKDPKLDVLVNLVLQNAKNPSIYYKNYFKDFLNLDNYKNLEKNSKINQYKVTPGDNRQILFKPFNINEDVFRTDQNPFFYVIFEMDRTYTLNQICWIICKTYSNILNAARKNPSLFNLYGIQESLTNAENIYLAVTTFINALLSSVMLMYGVVFEESDYLLLYTDIIEERIVGKDLSKVLYLTSRDKNLSTEQMNVKNIQYVPVIKQKIDEISIFIADEQGHQIVFESGKTPTCLTLHFRKNI